MARNDSIVSENWEIQSCALFPEENITLVISLIVGKLSENFTSSEWGAVETFMSKFARRDTRPSVVQNRADVFLQRPNMSELRLPYYSTPSLCWYPKWPKFPHCIANLRPPPSSPDLTENITTKVLFNTRQATTVRKSFTYSQYSQCNTYSDVSDLKNDLWKERRYEGMKKRKWCEVDLLRLCFLPIKKLLPGEL